MIYRPTKPSGDTVMVPRLLFSKLTLPGDDTRFKVALYLLQADKGEAREIAAALRIPAEKVESALVYWEGAGLIERDAAVLPAEPPAPPRRRMSTREAARAGAADPTLGALLGELQRLFGAVIGESEANYFVTLYVQDGFAADLILMAASVAARRGVNRAGYVAKILVNWRKNGVDDCAKADAALRLEALREEREDLLAKRWGLPQNSFTLAEKNKIAQWYEEYDFSVEMLDAARLAAGEHGGKINYLASVLKKWYAKGYRTPREVAQGEGGRNIRVSRSAAAKDDMLEKISGYVPMKRGKSS